MFSLTSAEVEKLLALGEGKAGCSGVAGFSTDWVSLPSIGSLMVLLDGSKPPMLAMYNNIAAAAIATAETVKTTADLRFNTRLCALYFLSSFVHLLQ